MKDLSIDIETFSSLDLAEVGVYKYSEAEDFAVLLFAYSEDGADVKVIDLACGEKIPERIRRALFNPQVAKYAYNAQFERVCLSRYLGFEPGHYLEPINWHCDMALAAICGLPSSLTQAGAALGLSEEESKMKEGKALIRYFCQPCKATNANGGRTKNLPAHDPAKWELFKNYNAQDVRTELAIRRECEAILTFPESEQKVYEFDQRLNDRGILLDLDLISAVNAQDEIYRKDLIKKAQILTGLENPNSVAQLKGWMLEQGCRVDSLNKDDVAILADSKEAPIAVKEALTIRRELSKSSVKKFQAMDSMVCSDNRVHGVLRYYGANRTGRWSGQFVQVQNLSKNKLAEIDDIRTLVKRNEFDYLSNNYSLSDLFSQLVRTAFIAPVGETFLIADYNAIEARVIAWLADETWVTDAFASNKDIYLATASQMFKVPYEELTHDSPLRAKGKIATLALGYGGAVGALTAMGALKMGLEDDELPVIVNRWRVANPHIVQLWHDADERVRYVVAHGGTAPLKHGVVFETAPGYLFIRLPSGRRLAYCSPRVADRRIYYKGVNQATRAWCEIDTFGGKIVENIVQAIARDCLATAMLQLASDGFSIVMHIHDEVIIEGEESDLQNVLSIMANPFEWAPGLHLKAAGYCSPYYRKD